MNTKQLRLMIAVASIVLLHSAKVYAQGDNEWIGAATSTNGWDVNGNWSGGFFPDPNFDANAKLGANTDIPTVPTSIEVTLTTDLSGKPSPRVILGEGSGYQGTLNLQSGSNFVTTTGAIAASANFDVGIDGGTGFLNVTGTGQLNVGGQLTTVPNGNPSSTITLQDSASVTAGALFNEHRLRIVGPDVSFSVAGNAILGGPGTHEWEFPLTGSSSGPSILYVGGQLSLDGTLKIDTLGETPAVGDSFVLADSQSVIQGFTNVDTSDIAGFDGLGQGVVVRAVSAPDAGSTNGVLTQVVIEQQPILVVHRRTGEVAIHNPSASNATIEFDAYVVGSSAGSLNASNWTSIAPGSGWQEANPTATALSELNPLSAQSLAADTKIAIGNVFQPADRPFGEDTDDVAFRIAPTGEEFVAGLVVYEGIATDTLTLNVDRTTGAAQVLNGFREAVSIDSYVIRSGSEALDTSGFTSIGGDWQVALNDPGVVSELNPLTNLTLSANEGQSLGALYDFDKVGAEEDFVFEFSLPTEDFFRTGKVVFDNELTDLQTGLPGDFNNDSVVNLADYTVWRDNLGGTFDLNGNGDESGGSAGVVDTQDYQLWKSQFGAMVSMPAAVSSAPVPEPATLGLLGMSFGAIVFVGWQRSRSKDL